MMERPKDEELSWTEETYNYVDKLEFENNNLKKENEELKEKQATHAKEFVRWMDQNRDLAEYRSLTELYELFELTQNDK